MTRPDIERWGVSGAPIVLVNLHEDEATSIEAMRAVSSEFECRALRLVQDGTREVRIGKRSVDPNRMFSSADNEVKAFADALLQELSDASLIVAAHNNKGESYTIRSYLERLQEDAAAVHLEPGVPETNFFLVTERQDYEVLVSLGQNAVLQSKDCQDDGSLSVWAQRNGKRYINVETLRGSLGEQVAMLRLILNRYCLPSQAL